MMRGKEYKLAKDLNTKYLKDCTLIRYFQESKKNTIIPNRLTKYATAGVLKGCFLTDEKGLELIHQS